MNMKLILRAKWSYMHTAMHAQCITLHMTYPHWKVPTGTICPWKVGCRMRNTEQPWCVCWMEDRPEDGAVTHTHTNIRDTYIYLTQRKVSSKLTFLIVTVCRRWSTAGNNLQPYLPFLGVWWRLASVTQPPRHPPISGSSLTRNTIQNQTVWIYFNAQGGYQICRACALALRFNWKSFPTPVLTLHYLV